MFFLFRFIHVADDGHMRLRCCGKYVTGIGNVPKWDPPRHKKLEEGPEADDNVGDGEDAPPHVVDT